MLRIIGCRLASFEQGNSHLLNRIVTTVLSACLLLLSPIVLAAAEVFQLEAMLELDPLDWSSIDPSQLINQYTLALANKQKLKEDQICRLYLLRGVALIHAGKEKDAVQDLTELLKIHPNDCQALRFRGDAYSMLGDFDKGQADFESLLKFQPKSGIGHACLALCLAERGHNEDCTKFAEKAIALDSEEPLGYLARAEAFLRTNHYPQALNDLNRCVTLSLSGSTPSGKQLFILRSGVLLNIFDDTKKALPDLLMARRLDPNDSVVTALICKYYFKTGKYNMAFHLSERLLKMAKGRLDLMYIRVNCFLALNRNDEALQMAESMMRQDSDRWGNYLCRGEVFFSQKMYKEALQDYDKSLSLLNDTISTMEAKAYLLAACPEAQFRDGPTARTLATKCCERTEYQVPRRLMLLAMACAECGDYKEAVRWAKKSLEKADPGFPFLADYRTRLALFEKEKPFRFSNDSPVYDYLCP